MSGNRKHGFARGNRGGFKPQPWFCDGCQKQHAGTRSRNGTIDGRSLCDRKYDTELAERVTSQTRDNGRAVLDAEPVADMLQSIGIDA